MTVLEAYAYVTNALNKLSSNSGQNIPKDVFVRFFNSVQYQWVEDRVKLNELNKIRIDEIQQLVTTVEIQSPTKKDQYYEFNLPTNYNHYIRSYSDLKGCGISNWLVKEGDINVLLNDEFWKPSKEWGETICTIGNEKIRVYYDDFTISKLNLVYYRYPVEINMADGFPDVNGNPTVDVDPEFRGSSLIEILNLTVQALSGNIDDVNRYNVYSQNVQSHT